jgi:MFS family permease
MKTKVIRQYYILSCLFSAGGLSIISAVYVTYLMKHGLDLFEVNIVNAMYFLTLFLCEIPTGAFADIFGRKTSFVIACALMSVSMFVYGLSDDMTGFIIAEMIGAVGMTFRSGAFKAWLVDSLKHYGDHGPYTKIFARQNLICQIANGFGAVLGSYLAVKNPSLPWITGGISLLVTTLVAMFTMKEEYFKRSGMSLAKGLRSMQNIAVSSIRYGKEHSAVRFVLMITAIQIFAIQALNMYWQPFFSKRGVAEKNYGYLFLGILICTAFGAYAISRMDTKNNERKIIIKSYIIVGILIIAMALSPGLSLPITFFMLHEIVRGSWSPMIDSYLQVRIPSDERATISSFCAIAPHIGGAIGLVISGIIAKFFGPETAWVVSGVCFVLASVLVAKNGKGKTD